MKGAILYTMFSGLGDFIVMYNAKKMAESSLGMRVFIAHRRNPYIYNLDTRARRDYFNIYSPLQLLSLKKVLTLDVSGERFGIQQAPGSIQGYTFLNFMRKIDAIDYIVDFNLINADIRTPPRGEYILEIHRNQLKTLFKREISFSPELPFKPEPVDLPDGDLLIAINPLSGRTGCNTYTWPYYKWKDLLSDLIEIEKEARFLLILKGERGKVYRELEKAFPERLSVYSQLTLGQLTYILEKCDLFLTVNSGPAHMAHFLGKKTVILSGPTLGLWNPSGPHIRVVRDEGARFPPSEQCRRAPGVPSVCNICTKDVFGAITDLLGKRSLAEL